MLADGGAVVRDLGSKNGTFMGGRRVREAAVRGFTMVAFGSTQAVLQPADPARTDVLLGSNESAGTSPGTSKQSAGTSQGTSQEGLTTEGLHPLERLAENLEGDPPFPGRRADLSRGGRLRAGAPLARRAPGGTGGDPPPRPRRRSVVAAASTLDAVPRNTISLEVEGPDGWKVLLRSPSTVRLAPLQPLLRLALASLAARRRPRRASLRLRRGRARRRLRRGWGARW